MLPRAESNAAGFRQSCRKSPQKRLPPPQYLQHAPTNRIHQKGRISVITKQHGALVARTHSCHKVSGHWLAFLRSYFPRVILRMSAPTRWPPLENLSGKKYGPAVIMDCCEPAKPNPFLGLAH